MANVNLSMKQRNGSNWRPKVRDTGQASNQISIVVSDVSDNANAAVSGIPCLEVSSTSFWGDKAETAVKRSIFSLKEFHPELDYEVRRLPPDSSPSKGLLEKSGMMDFSPFDETLFLDADTIVLDRLDFGFAQALRFGVACCICECPWSRRYRGLLKDDGVEYNTGVLFFTRDAAPLFARWKALSSVVDSAIDLVGPDGQPMVMPFNDQGSFARAITEWDRTPFILPMNWNFRPAWHRTFFGPIKIWHDYRDPPPELRQLSAAYRNPTAIIRFHWM